MSLFQHLCSILHQKKNDMQLVVQIFWKINPAVFSGLTLAASKEKLLSMYHPAAKLDTHMNLEELHLKRNNHK